MSQVCCDVLQMDVWFSDIQFGRHIYQEALDSIISCGEGLHSQKIIIRRIYISALDLISLPDIQIKMCTD